MSEVFEGIVFPGVVARLPVHGRCAEQMKAVSLDVDSTVVYCDNPRHGFSPDTESVAKDLSVRVGRALLVRYDSRLGHRSSKLYVAGEELASFGEDDELFVSLDERGYPNTSAEPRTRAEWESGEEYETINNAIQLGLERLGVGQWESLFDLIASGVDAMVSEDLAASVAKVTEILSAVSWKWTREFWDTIVASLPLEPESAALNTATYTWSHGYVHAYFEEPILETVVAELDIYILPDEISAEEYEELAEVFYAKYQISVQAITKILGKPAFDDDAAASDFPEDQDALRLALWGIDGARFMLQLKNEGLDVPFRLEIHIEK